MTRNGVLVFPATAPRHARRCACAHVLSLEHVANRPIAQHAFEEMIEAGVEEVVVAGPADVLTDVRASLSHRPGSRPKVDYAICAERSELVTTLQAAAPLVGAAPCIVHLGDGLLEEPLADHVAAMQEDSLDLLLIGDRPAAGGFIGIKPLAHGQGPGGPGEGVCEPGIAVFGPGAFRDACRAASNDARATGLHALARRLAAQGAQVEVSTTDGWRRYRGNPQDLLEVNRIALDRLPASIRRGASHHNRIEGRVKIDPSASVTTSVIVGPVVIGEGAEVNNAYIGPYTSIGAHARIEGVEIERSIILPGARVMHVGGRVVSSLVGRGAHVFRDFSLPRAMRLFVGEGDEVALC